MSLLILSARRIILITLRQTVKEGENLTEKFMVTDSNQCIKCIKLVRIIVEKVKTNLPTTFLMKIMINRMVVK